MELLDNNRDLIDLLFFQLGCALAAAGVVQIAF